MPSSVSRTELRTNLLLLLFTLILITGALEAGLRIIDPDKPKLPEKPKSDWALVPDRIWVEHHPLLGWFNQKNKEATLKIEYGETLLRTNSAGFRGSREYALERPADTSRVLMLGDSFVFGWGVLDDQTYAARLEQKNPKFEAPNLGIVGYGMDQIYLSYKHIGRNYKADYVFIGIFPEDFWRSTRAFSDTGHAKPYFKLDAAGELQLKNTPVPPPFTLRTNQFPDLIEYNPVESFLRKSLAYRFLRKKITRLWKNFGWVDPESGEEWILGRKILKQLIEEIRADGAEPVMLIIPPEGWISREKPDSLLQSLRRFSVRENVPLIDFDPILKDAVRNSPIADYYIPSDRHWTVKAHELASQTIADFLKRRGYAV